MGTLQSIERTVARAVQWLTIKSRGGLRPANGPRHWRGVSRDRVDDTSPAPTLTKARP